MKIFPQLLLARILAAGYAFTPTSKAQDSISQLAIAEKKITLPQVKGLVQVDLPPLMEMAKNMTYSANRLLGMYVEDDDYKALISGNSTDLRRYALVQTLRSLEQSELSAEGFLQISTKMKEQYAKSIKISQTILDQETKRVSQKIAEQTDDKSFDMKVGEIKVDQILEFKNAILILAKTIIQVQSEGAMHHVPMQVGMGTARVNGKLVYFYSYSRFESEKDVAWVRDINEQWFAAIDAANKQ